MVRYCVAVKIVQQHVVVVGNDVVTTVSISLTQLPLKTKIKKLKFFVDKININKI